MMRTRHEDGAEDAADSDRFILGSKKTESSKTFLLQDGVFKIKIAMNEALSCGIGCALAERLLADTFGTDLFSHPTIVIRGKLDEDKHSFSQADDASRTAIELGLDQQLAALFVDPSEDEIESFQKAGWRVHMCDGACIDDVLYTLHGCSECSTVPTLIACCKGGNTQEHSSTDTNIDSLNLVNKDNPQWGEIFKMAPDTVRDEIRRRFKNLDAPHEEDTTISYLKYEYAQHLPDDELKSTMDWAMSTFKGLAEKLPEMVFLSSTGVKELKVAFVNISTINDQSFYSRLLTASIGESIYERRAGD
jgi:hypothetical protein